MTDNSGQRMNRANSDRPASVARVVEDVIRRRSASEHVLADVVVMEHPDLMPELGEKLAALDRVERAEQLADSASTPGNGSSAGQSELGTNASSSHPPLIPGCEIIRKIHRGGQGVVYHARQVRTGREVAIKVLRGGPFRGPRDHARFEREIRVLAQLSHPNIVAIHDSGTTFDHQYFVMDYIPGEPLDVYMARQKRSVEHTLRLFGKICQAVNAAHLRGIIHRDLKPGNIQIDREGEPHILDFGLAKIDTTDITESSQWHDMTMTGQFVGSVPWSSPEQAEGPAGKVDLRTDIYSLGVILYHMLTAQFPYSVTGTMREIFRNIIETDPPRPSSIRTSIDEDLDIIVLTCLAKEPARRYQSTAAIVQDVERYLAHQPILARSPSTVYQLKQLIVRHKLPSMLLATLFVTAAASAIWLGVLYHRADAERQRATLAEQQAEAVNSFLVNDILASAHPGVARGRTITVEDALSNADERIASLADQPLIEASVREAMGQTYHGLGLDESAEEHLLAAEEIRSRELGGEHTLTLRARFARISVLLGLGRYAEMNILTKQTLDTTRRVFGQDHQTTLQAAELRARLLWRLGLIGEAKALHEDTLERRRRVLGDDHGATLSSLIEWSGILLAEGHMAYAEDVCRRCLADCQRVLGDDHPGTYGAMLNLGNVLLSQRQFEEAEVLLRGAHDGFSFVLDDSHPGTLSSKIGLALLFKEKDQLDPAEEILNGVIPTSERLLGGNHPLTLKAMLLLGNTLMRHGDPAAGAGLFRELTVRQGALGNGDEVGLAHTRDCLAYALTDLGRYAKAEEHHRESLDVLRRTVGEGSLNAMWSMRGLVRSLAGQGKHEEARPIAVELLDLRRESAEQHGASAYQLNCYARELLDVQPPDLRDPNRALEVALQAYELSSDAYHYNRYTLARAYAATGNLALAIPTLRRALDHAPIGHSRERADYEATLAAFFEEADDLQAAEQVYRETLARRRERLPEDHVDIATALEHLGWILLRHGKTQEAESILSECLAMRESVLDQHHWRTAYTRMLVGASFLAQGKLVEAESLLISGYEQMLQHEYTPRQQMWIVMEHVIELYENLEISDKVVEWRARLTELQPLQTARDS